MKSTFQILLLGIFIVFAVVGVIFFSLSGRSGDDKLPAILVWGTIDPTLFSKWMSEVNFQLDRSLQIAYEYKEENSFEDELIEALAEGEGPDVFLLSEDQVLSLENKIYKIPYEFYSLRDYKDAFMEEAELYLTPEGILAIPMQVDPLVTYWNRTIFTNAGFSTPPKYWDEFLSIVPKITEKDEALNISQSAVALGEWRNINNAKEILISLIRQAGNPIVAIEDDRLEVTLRDKFDYVIPPAEAALRFYTEFSNPVKNLYSWNRAIKPSLESFIVGDLAVYFGFASEFEEIQKRNPNLNFDIAPFPQSRDSVVKANYGKMLALAITRKAVDKVGTVGVINILTSQKASQLWSDLAKVAPARRDLLALGTEDPNLEVFYNVSVQAVSWLDPEPIESDKIFQKMIEDVISGKAEVREAVSRADSSLEVILRESEQ